MLKKSLTLFVLLSFIIIGFVHNSMMAFAMQDGMKMEMMGKISMECCDSNKDKTEKGCCFTTEVESNSNNSNKTLKINFIGFIDVLSFSSNFLENKNLIKNVSPPYGYFSEEKLKNYTSLTGIIKNNC